MNNFVKELRKNSTLPEKILWRYLCNRNFLGYKFRRQVQIDNYIADFVCFDTKLIIELDGRQHLTQNGLQQDKKRTEYLKGQNFKVLRFYNTDILNNIDSVLEQLKIELDTPLTHPPDTLSRKGRGDGTPSLNDTHELNTSRKGRGDGTPSLENSTKLSQRENVAESRTKFSSKQQLRKWAKEERKKLDIQALSADLVQKLQESEEYKQAQDIMIFYPKSDEINLLELLNDKSKKFYLPKIDGENLLCCSYTDGDLLCESCFKTKEPLTEPVDKSILDLVIVPALAVDKNNYRLGYGGGFYDRFLCDLDCKKIVCISSAFILETVCAEPHDIKMDLIINN